MIMKARLVILLAMLLLLVGCHQQGYPTREECLSGRLKDKSLLLSLRGEDTELILATDRKKGNNEVLIQGGIRAGYLHQVDGLWYLSSFHLSANRSEDYNIFFYDGIVYCAAFQPVGSADQYVMIMEGPKNAYESQTEMTSASSWNVSDSLHSEFQKLTAKSKDGDETVYYVTRLPAETREYGIRIDDWIIKNLDLRTDWTEHNAAGVGIQHVKEAGGF